MDYDNDNAALEIDCIGPSPVTCVDIVSNSWDPQRIEKAIVKGQELCKLKRRQCDVFRSPPCPARDRQNRYKPVPPCEITDPYNERLQSYCTPPAPPTYHYKGSRRRKCPLRILELATPSKRQCIETWRTMKDVLPEFMVERLRNLIMDENILVGIPEAFTTFKRKGLGVNKRSKKQTKSKARTTKDMDQIKMISALFGSKLVGKLYQPQATKLNPKLEKISKIVNKDVIDLIKKRNAKFMKDTQNEDILNEVSDRVAIWISLILQDASYKLLEEELKELEEQEGPVLDILDKLVNDVLDKVEPYPPEEDRSDTSGDEHFESVSEGGKSGHSAEHQFQDSFPSPEDIDEAADKSAKTQEQEIETDLLSSDVDEMALGSSETQKVKIKSDLSSSDGIDKSDLEATETQKQETEAGILDITEGDVNVGKIDNALEQNAEQAEHSSIITKSENTEDEKASLESENGDLVSARAAEKFDDVKKSNSKQKDHNQDKSYEDSSKLEIWDNNLEDQSLTPTLVPELDTIAKSPVEVNEIKESSRDVDTTNNPSEEKDKADNLPIENIASDTKVENTIPPEENSSVQKDVSTLNENIASDTKVENTIPPEEDSSVQKDVSTFDENIASNTRVENTIPPEEDSSVQKDVSTLNENIASDTKVENTIPPEEDSSVQKDVSTFDENIASNTKVENTTPPKGDSSVQKDVSTLNEIDKIHQISDDESDLDRFENKIKPGQEVTVVKDDKVDTKDEENDLDSSHTPKIHREDSVERKVKFSNSDIGRALKSMKPDLKLGPVNKNLLSDADESWPDKFIPLRPAASVTKSMESLGRIKEYDETHLTLQNKESKDTIDQIHKKDDSQALISDKNETSQEISRKKRSNDSIEISDTYYDDINSQLRHELGRKDDKRHTDDDAGDAKKFEGKHYADEFNKSEPQKYEATTQKDESSFKTKPSKFDYNKSNTIYTDDDTGDAKYEGKHYAQQLIVSESQKYKAITQKDELFHKTKSSKFDYKSRFKEVVYQKSVKAVLPITQNNKKVCLETAPSWVRTGHGEPSIDVLITRIKERQKFKKSCLTNWVTDLYNVATKLEKWNQWIDTANFNVVYLKKKRNVKHSGRRCHREIQDWVKLQKSVDNDALLWTKLYQRKRVKLQRNKEIPKQIKCECMRY